MRRRDRFFFSVVGTATVTHIVGMSIMGFKAYDTIGMWVNAVMFTSLLMYLALYSIFKRFDK